MNFTTLKKTNRQAGMALILAIGLLAVLSILGAVLMNVATRDLSETAVTLPNQRALYAADRSIEYSMNRDIIINLPVMGSLDLATDDVISATGTTLDVTHKQVIDGLGPGTLLAGAVSDVGPGSLPPYMAAIHGSEFGANMYHVNVETSAPLGKKVNVDASIVRLFKLDDDQIFRTSGGG